MLARGGRGSTHAGTVTRREDAGVTGREDAGASGASISVKRSPADTVIVT